jgi:hypothetical protein
MHSKHFFLFYKNTQDEPSNSSNDLADETSSDLTSSTLYNTSRLTTSVSVSVISSTPESSCSNILTKVSFNIETDANISEQEHQKRNSLVSPVSIRSYNSITNLASKKTDSSSNIPIISTTPPAKSFMKLPPPYPPAVNTTLPNGASREKRFSFSVEKSGQSLVPPKSGLANMFDKNKSFFDLSPNKMSSLGFGLTTSSSNSNLNGSVNNMSRSCSLYNYELDFVELKKMQISNTISQMNGITFCRIQHKSWEF